MIEFHEVSKTYKNKSNERQALENVSFRLEKGEILGVIGRNGAGKTTLFKILSGILKQDSGEVFIENKNNRTDLVSYLPETRGLDSRSIVIDHLADLLGYKGIRRSDAKSLVTNWLKEFGMEEYIESRISSLSNGNQQKIQFISAVANNPEILVLDEPFTGLDIIATDFFWKMIEKVRDQGTTILFSTHNLQDKISLCNKFLFLVNGQVAKFGLFDDIQNDFNKILELESEEINEQDLYQYLSPNEQERYRNFKCIMLDNENIAKELFYKLGNPYCEKFWVRKQSLEEIFRGVNEQ